MRCRVWSLVMTGAAVLAGAGAGAAHAGTPLRLEALSNRADLVSGGDVLVAVRVPKGVSRSAVRVAVGRRDVTRAFAPRGARSLVGLVTGMPVGRRTLVARAGRLGARLTVTNHPNGGPVFSGPQLQPWPCQPGALDAQCNAPTTYAFLYKPAGGDGLKAYDPDKPAGDVATTTTKDGRRVPFVVRVETGYQDRDVYKVATLYDPSKPWTALAPQPGWNGKIVVKQGQGCGTHHGVAGRSGLQNIDDVPDVLDAGELGLGYLVMAPALDNSSHSCNVALQSEAVMMLKEHVTETYGVPRFTIAQGCSGGSLSQLQDANAYPGLYQGLLPSCTFPDAWSSLMDATDCPLMEQFFAGPGIAFTPQQRLAIEGKRSPSICQAWTNVFPFYNSLRPSRISPLASKFGQLDLQNCGLRDEQIWTPARRDGVRCTIQDTAVQIFGRRPGDGYAKRALANVGVQYGLRPLQAGTITPAQFVDLNERIGSYDINLDWQPGRVAADPGASAAAYRSGSVNEATHLDQVAIIDEPIVFGATGNADIHEEYRGFALSARLDAAHGGHGNHVVWYGLAPNLPDALAPMDRWLTAIADDGSKRTLAQKVVANRPAGLRDICRIAGIDDLGGQRTCQELAGPGAATREPAGMPFRGDVIDCRLAPLRRSDYLPIQFTDAEWARLQATFPSGVCDWSVPGNGQQPTVPWQTYAAGPGGRPLGPAPRSRAFRVPRG